jgi:hypothetical protein
MVAGHLNDGIDDKNLHVVYSHKHGEIGTHTPKATKNCGKGALANMMRVIERLLNIEDLGQFSLKKNNQSLKGWAQKLNGLCYLVSRENFKLSWKVGEFQENKLPDTFFSSQEDLNEKDLKFVFSINGRDAFSLICKHNHFQIDLILSEKKNNWRQEKFPKDSVRQFLRPIDLAWYVDPSLEEEFLKAMCK